MSHTAELIAVGTELLLGTIANTDAQMLSKGLSALGIHVYHHTVVGDNPQRLRGAVELAKGRADIIITTGGLGPTCDDLTKNVLAEVFGKELVYDEASAQRIQAYFERLHIQATMTKNNLRQAMLPEGCTILENDWGTAPGCAFEADGVHVIMLPGPPQECGPMFQFRVAPYLKGLSDGAIISRTLKLFGIGESALEDLLREQMNTMDNPTLAPYAKEGEVELRITAKAATAHEAGALIDPVEIALCRQLGTLIYGVDVDSMEQVVTKLLKVHGMTMGTAESCTGGLIAKRMTDLPGSSAVFCGGVVSYSNQLKHRILGVPQELLDKYGAVSEQVARAMAEGALGLLGSDLAVATTGVAGPDSDDWGNPVGLVYVALATPEHTLVHKIHGGIGRERIRTMAANHAFDMVRRYLGNLDSKKEAVAT